MAPTLAVLGLFTLSIIIESIYLVIYSNFFTKHFTLVIVNCAMIAQLPMTVFDYAFGKKN